MQSLTAQSEESLLYYAKNHEKIVSLEQLKRTVNFFIDSNSGTTVTKTVSQVVIVEGQEYLILVSRGEDYASPVPHANTVHLEAVFQGQYKLSLFFYLNIGKFSSKR